MRLAARWSVLWLVGLGLIGGWAVAAGAAPKTDAELQAIACGANADKLQVYRAAAGEVLAKRWAKNASDPKALPTATLTAAITDIQPECRAAAIEALFTRVIDEGKPWTGPKIQALLDSAKDAATAELGFVRAGVAVELVRAGWCERGTDDCLVRLETVAGGDKGSVRGVNFDGSVKAVREGVGRVFLTGFYSFFGPLTTELGAGPDPAAATCNALRARARDGKSPEIRSAAASAYVAGVVVDRVRKACVAGDALVTATLKGSAAVQVAAVSDSAAVSANSPLSDQVLFSLAVDYSGRNVQAVRLLCTNANDESSCEAVTTASFRTGCALALGIRWLRLARDGKFSENTPVNVGGLYFNLRSFVEINAAYGFNEVTSAAIAVLVFLYDN